MYKYVASLDSKLLKVRGKFVSSDLPKTGASSSAVSALAVIMTWKEGTKEKERSYRISKGSFLLPRTKLYVDVSGLLQPFG